jgi:uncharacterized membrane protein YgcG
MLLLLAISSPSFLHVHAEYYLCNVCQNSDQGLRYLADRSESFVNPSTQQTWTCGELQDAVQDVDPTSSGAAGEARLCYIYQIYAEQYCTCNGPEVPSLINGPYQDIHESCNLCEGYELNYVPDHYSDQTIYLSEFGTQNCFGLFEAALEGNVLDEDSCESVRAEFEECCTMPDLPDNESGSSSSGGGGGGGGSSSGSNGGGGGSSSSGGGSGSSSGNNSSGNANDNPSATAIGTFVGGFAALLLLNCALVYVICFCFARQKD